MYKQLLKFALPVILLMGSPVHADSLCGSDTSSDPVGAMGKEVWLTGYCKGFLPCRLAYEQFRGCQAAESFLSNLGAQEGQPLTEAQVEEALVRTKRMATASTPRMAKISATSERDRVATLDSSTAAALQSDCTERACMNYREKQLNLLTSEVEKLNSNADILYWLPEYAPVQAFNAAERLGWKRQGGQWVFSGAQAKESATTPGQYLLSVAECQKLYEKLDQEIKANPGKQPDNLSFFEAECVPQVTGYAEKVKGWRAQWLAGKSPEPQAADLRQKETQPDTGKDNVAVVGTPSQVADTKSEAAHTSEAADALSAWHGDVIAEESGQPRRFARRFNLAGGCHVYLYDSEDTPDYQPEVRWTGPCVAGEPVNGSGDLSVGGDVPYGQDYPGAQLVNGRLEVKDMLLPETGGESRWWGIASYSNGCRTHYEYLGYQAGESWGDAHSDEISSGHFVVNKTHKGVKYYDHRNSPAGNQFDTDEADKACVAAFAKLR